MLFYRLFNQNLFKRNQCQYLEIIKCNKEIFDLKRAIYGNISNKNKRQNYQIGRKISLSDALRQNSRNRILIYRKIYTLKSANNSYVYIIYFQKTVRETRSTLLPWKITFNPHKTQIRKQRPISRSTTRFVILCLRAKDWRRLPEQITLETAKQRARKTLKKKYFKDFVIRKLLKMPRTRYFKAKNNKCNRIDKKNPG